MSKPDHTGRVTAAWKAIHPSVDARVLNISVRLIRAGRALEGHLDKLASANGFAVSGDYEVLAAIRRVHPLGLQPADLADMLMVTSSGMTGRLDRLEAASLIKRRQHPTDRRAIEVFATAKGIQLTDKTFLDRVAAESRLLGQLTDSHIDDLEKALTALLTILEESP